MPPDIAASVRQFLEEERLHTQVFRRLNRLAENSWYELAEYHILQVPAPFLARPNLR